MNPDAVRARLVTSGGDFKIAASPASQSPFLTVSDPMLITCYHGLLDSAVGYVAHSTCDDQDQFQISRKYLSCRLRPCTALHGMHISHVAHNPLN